MASATTLSMTACMRANESSPLGPQCAFETIRLPTVTKARKAVQLAHRAGADIAVIIGPNEGRSGIVKIRDMRSGEQIDAAVAQASSAANGLAAQVQMMLHQQEANEQS